MREKQSERTTCIHIKNSDVCRLIHTFTINHTMAYRIYGRFQNEQTYNRMKEKKKMMIKKVNKFKRLNLKRIGENVCHIYGNSVVAVAKNKIKNEIKVTIFHAVATKKLSRDYRIFHFNFESL